MIILLLYLAPLLSVVSLLLSLAQTRSHCFVQFIIVYVYTFVPPRPAHSFAADYFVALYPDIVLEKTWIELGSTTNPKASTTIRCHTYRQLSRAWESRHFRERPHHTTKYIPAPQTLPLPIRPSVDSLSNIDFHSFVCLCVLCFVYQIVFLLFVCHFGFPSLFSAVYFEVISFASDIKSINININVAPSFLFFFGRFYSIAVKLAYFDTPSLSSFVSHIGACRRIRDSSGI